MSPDPICQRCKHLREKLVEPTDSTSAITCEAFPHGIPDEWLLEEHTAVQKNQVGTFVFEESK